MSTLAVICARGGSKGVPLKNIRPINGKPLISWTIEQALRIKDFSNIIVSSDSHEIIDIACSYGIDVPFVRPLALSNDKAGKWDVWQHALSESEVYFKKKFDCFVDLDCTCPLREDSDIYKALNQYNNKNVDGLVSVSPSRKNPYFNMVELSETGLKISKPLPEFIKSRQEAPVVFDHIAALYVLNTNYLRKAKNLFDGNVYPYDLGVLKGVDIDTEADFEYVQYMLSNLERNTNE